MLRNMFKKCKCKEKRGTKKGNQRKEEKYMEKKRKNKGGEGKWRKKEWKKHGCSYEKWKMKSWKIMRNNDKKKEKHVYQRMNRKVRRKQE